MKFYPQHNPNWEKNENASGFGLLFTYESVLST
jgi:hypothetical protein